MSNCYSYTKLINKCSFVVLIEDEESYNDFDEILSLCEFPYQLDIIDNIYEFTINVKYFDLIYKVLSTSNIHVLQIKQ